MVKFMKKKNQYFVYTISGMWIIPYLLTVVVNGMDTVFMKKEPGIEEVLPVIVSFQIADEYEDETLAAQSVVARSNLYRNIEQKEKTWDMVSELYDESRQWNILHNLLRYENAVEETKDHVLTVEGELKLVPYHEMSAGRTRDGQEVLHNSEYSYLKSVESNTDKDSADYLSSIYVSEQQLPEELKINERDSSGYVLSMRADENILEGEAFSSGLGLASSNFSMQNLGDQVRFLCKGKGHGLGFSQYGGNEMAKEGNNWKEILEKYFPEMEITVYNEENKV